MLPKEREGAALAVYDSFFRHVSLLNGKAVVGGYWPVKGEVDTLHILDELRRRGHICGLPHMTGEGAPLLFRQWDTGEELIAGKFGIPEPPADSAALVPDILLVPLLAFDEKRHRLGYGGGFYDRTLARLKPQKKTLAVGLAYEMQLYNILPHEPNDVRMDIIITDRKVYS